VIDVVYSFFADVFTAGKAVSRSMLVILSGYLQVMMSFLISFLTTRGSLCGVLRVHEAIPPYRQNSRQRKERDWGYCIRVNEKDDEAGKIGGFQHRFTRISTGLKPSSLFYRMESLKYLAVKAVHIIFAVP
jgi:hypothetical protein